MDYDKKEKEIMPTLTIRQKRHWFEPKLPHSVFLNGYFVGMLKDDQLRGEVPPIYKILSDAFFAIWIVRLVLIRKRYYKIVAKTELSS